MTLAEIFKDKPGLLEVSEVKRLISYVQEQHKRSFKINAALKDKEHKILEIIMYSEIMIINGTPSKAALGPIADLISE